jgi:CPA1 family monovalent cation:H+ antiporter
MLVRMAPVLEFQLILGLLAIAVLLAFLARQLRIPPSAAYVLGGMGIALVPGLPKLVIEPSLILPLFLPPLLQNSAFFTVWRDFRANLRPILLLAVGCVVFTTFIVGVVLKLAAPAMPWAACFLLGAIVSPPDAVSASSVLQRLRIPRRLRTIIEGESLVNDASGLVLVRFAAAATLTGTFSPIAAVGTFVFVAAAGIAVGLVFGRLISWITPALHDAYLEIVGTFLVAYASYMAAEAIGASGVLSVVACGLTMGWLQHASLSPTTRVQARVSWRVAVFMMEALVFVLIGLSLNGVLERLGAGGAFALFPLALIITAAVIAARFVWVYPATYLPRLFSRRLRAADPAPSPRAIFVVSWAGMRGVVSLAVALALPTDLPGYDMILFLTFFIILVTVLVQGTTLGPVIRALGVARPPDPEGLPPEARARAEMERAALMLIEQRATDEIIGPIARELVAEFRERAGFARRSHERGAAARAERAARLSLRIEALGAARSRLLALHRSGDIHDDVLQALEQELDLDELRLREQLAH